MIRFLVFALVCCAIRSEAQFPVHMLLPMGVNDIAYGDTLINNSALLRKQQIRSIVATPTFSKKAMHALWTVRYDISEGRYLSRKACVQQSPDSAFRFCLRDTAIYDASGRLRQSISMDGSGAIYLKVAADYEIQGMVTYTTEVKDSRHTIFDTSYQYHFFNEEGRLVRVAGKSRNLVYPNAFVFYHADGLPDSIRFGERPQDIWIFQRKNYRNKLELTAQMGLSIYTWTFNNLKQFVELDIEPKTVLRNGQAFGMKIMYSYNEDGLLTKVVEKGRDGTLTTSYRYER